MTKRFSISNDAMREIDAVAATLRAGEDRAAFIRDVVRILEMGVGLTAASITDVEKAISDTIGITRVRL